jgi:hypothetical protein
MMNQLVEEHSYCQALARCSCAMMNQLVEGQRYCQGSVRV